MATASTQAFPPNYVIGNEALAVLGNTDSDNPFAQTPVTSRRDTMPDGPTSIQEGRAFLQRIATAETINTYFRGPLDIDNLTCESWEMRQQYRSLMLKEPAVKAALFSKIQAVANLDPQVIPDAAGRPADKAAAKFLDWSITNSHGGWAKLIESIGIGGLIDGFSVGEKKLTLAESPVYSGFWTLEKVYQQDTQWIRFDIDQFKKIKRVRLTKTSPQTSFNPDDFVIFQHMQLFESPFGISDLRAAYRAANLIEASIKLRAILLENYSGPYLVAKYPVGQEAVRRQLEQVLPLARSLGWISVPVGSELEVINLAASGIQQFQDTIDDLRKEIYTAIRGAYLPFTEAGSGVQRGDTSVQKSITEIFETWLAGSICEAINLQLVPDLITPNFGSQAGKPRIQLGGINLEKVGKQLDVIERVQKMAGNVSRKQVFDLTRVEQATDANDQLSPPQPEAQPGAPAGPGGGMPPGMMPPGMGDAGGGPPDPNQPQDAGGTPAQVPAGASPSPDQPNPLKFSDAAETGWPPAGFEGERLAAILEPSINATAKTIVEATKAALHRALPTYTTDCIWDDDHRHFVVESLATLMALSDAIARGRLHQNHPDADGAIKFADPSGTASGGLFGGPSGDAPFAFIPRPIKPIVGGPVKAIEYIASLVPTPGVFDALHLADGYRRKAFTIAMDAESTILTALKDAVVAEVSLGNDATSTIQNILDAAGLKPKNPQYAEMVARTNAMDAYDEGFHQELQVPSVQSDFPVWFYSGIRDGREGDDHRPHFGTYHHAAVDFRTVRGKRIYNCRCKPIPVYKSKWKKLQAEGKTIELIPESARQFSDPTTLDPLTPANRYKTLLAVAADLADEVHPRTLSRILTHLADDPIRFADAAGIAPPATHKFSSGEYDEHLHPRDDHGRWVNKADIQAAKGNPEKAAELRSRVTDPAQREKLDAALGDKGGSGSPKARPVAAPAFKTSDELLDDYNKSGQDLGKTGKAVADKVAEHLKSGHRVAYWVDGKRVEIKSIINGMPADAEGKRWGVMGLLSPTKGTKSGIEVWRSSGMPVDSFDVTRGRGKELASKARSGSATPGETRELLGNLDKAGDISGARNRIESDPNHSTAAVAAVGDHVRDVAAGKAAMPPHPVHDRVQAMIAETPHLSPEQKQHYSDSMSRVLGAMPTPALDALHRNLHNVAFQGDVKKVGEAAIAAASENAFQHPHRQAEIKAYSEAFKSGKMKPGGAYLPKSGEVFVDGDKNDKYPTHEVYAHILAHVVNGPDKAVSSSHEWQEAWREELANKPGADGKLNRYAGTSASEGMAEFSRLLYASGKSVDEVRRQFPKATAAFESHGLLPTAAEKPAAAAADGVHTLAGPATEPLSTMAKATMPDPESIEGHPDNWMPQTPLTSPAGLAPAPIMPDIFGQRVSLDGIADGAHVDALVSEKKDNGTPTTPEIQHVYTVPRSSLKLDPTRFQYKVSGVGEGGVTKALKGVTQWNHNLGGTMLVWRDPETGEDNVVNGHHRYELAGRTNQDTMNVRYIQAGTAKEARAIGALANIAEGSGKAVDAAKYLRDSGGDIQHLRNAGISPTSKLANDAAALTDLADGPFQALTQGRLDESTAVTVAANLKDHDLQNLLFKKIKAREDDGRDWSTREIETAAKKMAQADSVTTDESNLFGSYQETKSTFDQEVELQTFAAKKLSTILGDFTAVGNVQRAGRLSDTGNVLALAENKKSRQAAQVAADTFDQLANRSGHIADTIKKYAAELAQAGDSPKEQKDVRDRFFTELNTAIGLELSGTKHVPKQPVPDDAGGASPSGASEPGSSETPSDAKPAASVSSPAAEEIKSSLAGPDADIDVATQTHARDNYPTLRESYLNKGMGTRDADGTLKNVTLNTDDFRDLFPQYTGTNAAAVHEASSQLNKKLYAEALKETAGKGNQKMLILAGGGGSGKGTAVKGHIDLEQYPITLDQVSDNYKKLQGKIQEARDAGFTPQFVFIDRHPESAWTEGVVKRAVNSRSKGELARTVPVEVAVHANIEARKAALQLLKDNPDVDATVIDNNRGFGQARLLTDRPEAISFLEAQVGQHDHAQLLEKLRNDTLDLHESGSIPADIAEGLVGKTAISNRRGESGQSGSGEGGGGSSDGGGSSPAGGTPGEGQGSPGSPGGSQRDEREDIGVTSDEELHRHQSDDSVEYENDIQRMLHELGGRLRKGKPADSLSQNKAEGIESPSAAGPRGKSTLNATIQAIMEKTGMTEEEVRELALKVHEDVESQKKAAPKGAGKVKVKDNHQLSLFGGQAGGPITPKKDAEPAAADAGHALAGDVDHSEALGKIPKGEVAFIGGHKVRHNGGGIFTTERDKTKLVGDAGQVSDHIRRNWKDQLPERKAINAAVSRAGGFTEPDPFTDPKGAEENGKKRSAVPDGTRAVSLEPDTRGRVGTIIRDAEGNPKLKLDGQPDVSPLDFEPLDAKHSWRDGKKSAEPEAKKPAAKPADLTAGMTPEPSAPKPAAAEKPRSTVWDNAGLPYDRNTKMPHAESMTADHLPKIEQRLADIPDDIDSLSERLEETSDPFRKAGIRQAIEKAHSERDALEDIATSLRANEPPKHVEAEGQDDDLAKVSEAVPGKPGEAIPNQGDHTPRVTPLEQNGKPTGKYQAGTYDNSAEIHKPGGTFDTKEEAEAESKRLADTRNAGNAPATPESSASTPELPPVEEPAAVKAHVNLANVLAEKFRNGETIDSKMLFAAADKAHGGSRAQNKYGPSDAYDSLEAGLNKSLVGQTNPSQSLEGAIQDAARLEQKVLALPTQTARSGNKNSYQQFSTPPHYAYAAAWLANLKPADLVLEPSAGTGCLAVQAANTGAQVVANELDPRRADFLSDLFGSKNVHVEDATQISGILPKRGVGAPSAVVMNPPFSQTAGRMGDKKQILEGAKHISEAMSMLAPNGRLVAIVGEGMQPDSKAYSDWFAKMKQEYSLRANVGVSGDEYKKFGTSFGSRILIFDNTGPHQGTTVTGNADNIPHLMAMLEGVRNDRPASTPGTPAQSVRGGVPTGNAGAGGSGSPSSAVADSGMVQPGDAGGSSVAGDVRPGKGNAGSSGGGGSGARFKPDDDGLRDVGSGVSGSEVVAPPPATVGGVDVKSAPGTPSNQDGAGTRKPTRAKPISLTKTRVPAIRPPEPVKVRSVTPEEDAKRIDDARVVGGEGSSDDIQGPGDAMYETYRPSKLRIEGARPHVTKLVEPAALAAVMPPHPTYQPMLSPDVVHGGMFVEQENEDGSITKREIGLSEAGLEGVQSAGQAHQRLLPAAEGAAPRRCGHMIGDGTGTGKGREASGIIADSWNRGHKKAVWVSEKNKLFNDAKRDWADLGMNPDDLIHFDDLKKGAFTHESAVVFVPYSLLRAGPTDNTKPRNHALLEKWLGKDFAGAMIFDEAHNMGNADDTKSARGIVKASKQALAALSLERSVPNAKVSFFSATGATELENLSYLDRLGIWGRATAFATKSDFLNKMKQGGMAALEAVSQSLKARGLYISRSLSFDGVKYNKIQHPLSPDDKYSYDSLAECWRHVLAHVDKAIEHLSGGEPEKAGAARGAAMSQFWGSQQRFFNQVMTSIQTRTCIAQMEKDLAEGRSPVVSLFNTMEASTKRALSSREEGEELEELDVGPKQILTQFLEKSFPVHRLQEVMDENGNSHMVPVMTTARDEHGNPMHDAKGNEIQVPVEDPKAVAMRNQLMAQANELNIHESPLDMVINHFGHENVAECTGRTTRLVNKVDPQTGQLRKVQESRDATRANEAESGHFQGGRKKILIFSAAGGTGASYHADRAALNQNQRSHYMLQLSWRADTNVQAMGRTHRTNQVSAPVINLMEIPEIPGQKRFVSTTMRRLAQLGALTQGQAKSAGGGDLFSRADNLESKESQAGLDSFFHAMKMGAIPGLDYMTTMRDLGLVKPEQEGKIKATVSKASAKEETIEMRQFLNRMLVLGIDHQQQVFGSLEDFISQKYDEAEKNGTLDSGVENFPGVRKVIKRGEQVVNREPESGAEAKIITATVHRSVQKTTWDDISNVKHPPQGYYKNSVSGKVWAAFKAAPKVDQRTGSVTPQTLLRGPSGSQIVNSTDLDPRMGARGGYSMLGVNDARGAWDSQHAETPDVREGTEHFVTGDLLSVWDKLPTDRPKIYRLKLDDGTNIVGRHIPSAMIDTVRSRLGVASGPQEQHDPEDVFNRVTTGQISAKLGNGWELKRSRVGNENRIELVGPTMLYKRELEEEGVNIVNMNFTNRYFLPNTADGGRIFRKILQNRNEKVASVS